MQVETAHRTPCLWGKAAWPPCIRHSAPLSGRRNLLPVMGAAEGLFKPPPPFGRRADQALSATQHIADLVCAGTPRIPSGSPIIDRESPGESPGDFVISARQALKSPG